MKILAFNGSPRKKWNTATLLQEALKGAETELIHLYDLDYKGCKSCFACKKIGGPGYGKCTVNDDLKGVFQKVENSDAIILGSPIYFGTVSGEIRSFMERLMFPYLTYTKPPQSLFPKKINIGFIYTMNISKDDVKPFSYDVHFNLNEKVLNMLFGHCESVFSFDTYQFKDYSKVVSDRFNPDKKALQRKEVFPEDCRKAFNMGVRFASS